MIESILEYMSGKLYDKKMDNSDYEMLEILEKNYTRLEELDKPTLIEIIKAQRKKMDELENIKRTAEDEVIIQDDGEEVISDDEEYL